MTFFGFLRGPRRQPDVDIAAETAAIIHLSDFPFEPICQQQASLNRQRLALYEERLKHEALKDEPDKFATEEAVARRADTWRERLAAIATFEQFKRGNETPAVDVPAEPPPEISRIDTARKRQGSR